MTLQIAITFRNLTTLHLCVLLVLNKIELLQSQAPVDWELSGSSASDRHGTLDIVHQTWNVGHGDIEILKILKRSNF